ncbi:EF-hand calcium-binding domain-containing protein 4B [Clupea harengus]|uniref:EF-hand calcium-binding domain-containing protein 4B n=1 Tax=Clupea harengus TaxID=7950 RepID=A0A6P3W351_CLUHA|nr:EF-hand calcium-binding domain-containing protein 4B [Clupea harengus]XP_031420397.1 EF-hand calcium-binding domain-containing protein 4B [Clupea harengus]
MRDIMANLSSISASAAARVSRPREGRPLKESTATEGEVEEGYEGSTLMEKTQEFFQLCDIQQKGFITRRDMQRLHGELPLSADELENVFDTLDADGNGYLTLDEFSSGFSEFMFGQRVSVSELGEEGAVDATPPEALYQSRWEESLTGGGGGEEEEERNFCMLMESLGASNVFEDPVEVRSLWAQLRQDEPHLLANFEEFLARVTFQIKEANQERQEMESALKRKAVTHDDEIQRLYEEMEQQIKNEKERILLQDSERFLSRSQDMEHQLSSKERELDHLFQKQKRLEGQCRDMSSEQQETRVENAMLRQTNEELQKELEHTTQELDLAQDHLGLLQEQASQLHEEKELEMYRVTEGLQRERASLLKQLDLLREMNKHLRDEKDMCYQKPMGVSKIPSLSQRSASLGSRYTERKSSFKSDTDEEEVPSHSKRKSMMGLNGHSFPQGQEEQGDGALPITTPPRKQLQRIISIEEDHLPDLLQEERRPQLHQWSEEEDLEEGIDLQMSNIYPPRSSTPSSEGRPSDAPTSPRHQPVGKETICSAEGASSSPDRLFKIVLVGNSSVGKTSLLRRFCNDSFYPGTSATVGIDYSVKTITVDGSQVALQMWDTAGQERYRSITKQFFRKADGVVVMYDITAQLTFTSVRQWLTSVQEGAGEDIPIMLLANKTDLEGQREVQGRVGESLSKELQLIFYECSAFSGHNVTEAMVHLARLLKEQEDWEKEKTVTLLASSSKKKSCC